MRTLFFLLLSPFIACAQNALPAIGGWREHLPYQGAVDVTASGKKVYAATPYSLFSVDLATKEIERFSKVSGLAETGVSALQYDPFSDKLFVAYNNSNVDVLTPGGIRNIPDIKRSAISGDKNIYAIYPDGARCYLATGLGVIVLDADKYEVKESWFIGGAGGYVKTNGFAKANNFYYAATEEGLKRAPTSTPNAADFRAWQNLAGTGGLPVGPAKAVVFFGGKIIALQNDTLFAESGGVWQRFFGNGWNTLSVTVSSGNLLVTQRRPGAGAQVLVVNGSGAVQKTVQGAFIISTPKKAVMAGNDVWTADGDGGLSQFTGNGFEIYKLNSPQNIVLGEMTVRAGVLRATAGAVNDSWNYQYNPNGLFSLQQGQWEAYNLYRYRSLDSLLDFVTVAVDPRDNTAWAGSFGGGLVHFDNSGFPKIFKQNSPIGPTIGDPGSYRVSGLAFDGDNNLWVANFGSARGLHVLKRDGTWQSFTVPFNLFENAVGQLLIDDAGQKWIQSPQGNGLMVFSEGVLAATADDKWKLYKSGAGLGNLPSNEVLCLAKDKSGFVWVGTDNGIGVFQCPQEVFGNGCEAVWPVIKEGGFANYLFRGQAVRSIAVDGADRKWVATSSGLWLISRDGDKVLANYTEQNSPLLSNDVRRIAIDGASGEVFVATAKGLLSFRGAATAYEESNDSVLVFPNPVPPGFGGSIGIRGLPENAVVKITEGNGRLVYQTRSLGGQAVWNGKDYRGNKALSGVYLVIAVDSEKGEKVVAKIVVVK